ncbi:hypothetical protein Efla_004246 [Eimeria flavescens]
MEEDRGPEVEVEAKTTDGSSPQPAVDNEYEAKGNSRPSSLPDRMGPQARYGALAAVLLALLVGVGAFRHLRAPAEPLSPPEPVEPLQPPPDKEIEVPPPEEQPGPPEELPPELVYPFAPAPPAPPTEPQEPWTLPTLAELESRLPPRLKHAKEKLAFKMKSAPVTYWVQPSFVAESQQVAQLLSEGLTKQLAGLRMTLGNITPVGGGAAAESASKARQLVIKGVVGKGTSNLILRAVDPFKEQVFVVRIFVKDSDDPASEVDEFKEEARASIKRECKIAEILAEGRPAREASNRGLALPLMTADINGLEEVSICPKMLIHNRVQLWQSFWGDLSDLQMVPPPMNADMRVYLSQSMLVSMLHMQQAKVAHLDIKMMNILMDKEARPHIADYGSSNVLGEVLPQTLTLTPVYTERELLLSYVKGDVDEPVTAEAASDIWSCGVLLYELFTNSIPYNLEDLESEMPGPVLDRLEELHRNNVRPSSLLGPMEEHRVPPRWQQLIVRMLDVNRESRITGEGIMSEFRDLVDGRGGVQESHFEEPENSDSGELLDLGSSLVVFQRFDGLQDNLGVSAPLRVAHELEHAPLFQSCSVARRLRVASIQLSTRESFLSS